MPELVLFRGRPVKRRRRLGDQLHLLFFSAQPGRPGEQLIVNHGDWSRYGSVKFFPKEEMPNVRALAAQPFSNP